MPASHQGPNHTGMNLYQPACSVGHGALDSSSLSQHSVPFFNFQRSIVLKLGSDLVLSLDSFFHLFSWFWSITLWLISLSFQGGESRGFNAGAVLGTEPRSHLPHSGKASITRHNMTFHSSHLNAFAQIVVPHKWAKWTYELLRGKRWGQQEGKIKGERKRMVLCGATNFVLVPSLTVSDLVFFFLGCLNLFPQLRCWTLVQKTKSSRVWEAERGKASNPAKITAELWR